MAEPGGGVGRGPDTVTSGGVYSGTTGTEGVGGVTGGMTG